MWKQRHDYGYNDFRRAVLKRDKGRCQMPKCGTTRWLQVHHIRDYASNPHLRTETSNGITLCGHCHKGIKGKEHNFIGLFDSIVRQNETKRRKIRHRKRH